MRTTAFGIVLPISIFTAYIIRSSSFVLTGDEGHCDGDWFSAGSSCFAVISTPKTFEEANAYCESASSNGTMAELETMGEKMRLVTKMRTTYEIVFTGQLFWVGARSANDGTFVWNSGEEVNYTDYVDGTEQNEGCLAFGTTTAEKYQPTNCTEYHITICESRPSGNLTGLDPALVG